MDLDPYDHVRPTVGALDGEYEPGIYRVVGTDGDSVTLLRVGDSDGRRVSSGTVVGVSSDELDAFEPAENPDGNRPLGARLVSLPATVGWSFVAFGQQLAARPLPAAAALALFAVGLVGESALGLQEPLATVIALVGALALTLLGSGRL